MTFSIWKFNDLTSTKKAATILDYQTKLERVDSYTVEYNGIPYSMVGFKISLQRHSLKYLINWYFPSLIFVLVSWMSFLIPNDVIPGRMALLITLLLVLINMFSTVLQLEPPSQVSFLKKGKIVAKLLPTKLTVCYKPYGVYVTVCYKPYCVYIFAPQKKLSKQGCVTVVRSSAKKCFQEMDHIISPPA